MTNTSKLSFEPLGGVAPNPPGFNAFDRSGRKTERGGASISASFNRVRTRRGARVASQRSPILRVGNHYYTKRHWRAGEP